MANPTYPKGFPAHLATNFRWMVSNGRSAAQVCEILTMVLRHREIKTVPPLPDGWRLLPVGGELKIEATDGTIYDAREMTLRQMAQDILDKTPLATLKLTVCAEHAGRLVVIQITVSSGQATGSGALTSQAAALASSGLSSSTRTAASLVSAAVDETTNREMLNQDRWATVAEGSRAARKRQSEVRKTEKEAARAILIPEKIDWLARKMSPDGRPDPEDNVKKGTYKAACMKRGIITKRDYEEIIWREARKKAGLPPKAKSGPKRQRKK